MGKLGFALIFLTFSLFSTIDAGLLGDVQAPVEFFELHVNKENPDQIFKDFELFVKKFKKDYKTQEEKTFRFNQFTRNHNEIGRLNAEAQKSGKNVTFGINHFADLTKGEFIATLSHAKPAKSKLPVFKKRAAGAVTNSTRHKRRTSEYPSDLDLRRITVRGESIIGPVKSQGICGCCWAFASTAVTETAFAVNEKEFVVLSDQEICDCATEGDTPGCVGGQPSYGLEYVYQYGQTEQEIYPYEDGRANKTGRCKLKSTQRVVSPGVFDGYYIDSQYSEEDIIETLNVYKTPVAVYFRVGQGFEWYTDGIFSKFDCDQMDPTVYHSLAIVGYGTSDDGEDYWLLRNSWAEDWGDDGYAMVARGINWCDIEDNPVTVRYVEKRSRSKSRKSHKKRRSHYDY